MCCLFRIHGGFETVQFLKEVLKGRAQFGDMGIDERLQLQRSSEK